MRASIELDQSTMQIENISRTHRVTGFEHAIVLPQRAQRRPSVL
jgi:hypothetical protein